MDLPHSRSPTTCRWKASASGEGSGTAGTIDEVRDAVRDFIARYNAEWLIEKNGLRSPSDIRAAWRQTVMKVAA